jgi:hypothetical protein
MPFSETDSPDKWHVTSKIELKVRLVRGRGQSKWDERKY